MDKYEGILKNIARYVELTEEEKEQFTSIIKVSRIKKRQFVIQPGYVCEYRNYIVKGAFRVFYLDDKGKEHTVSIGVEDWYFTDFYSYINQLPAAHFAEALEDSVILQLKYEDIEGLCAKIHGLSEYFRRITEKAFASSRTRVISNNSKTSEERYLEYAKKYPQIVNRVPQYVIASYLGISAEFLSKIRARR
ncbi:Crp/Fnr family transcriptional regulator [uncultured Tenacibaculum sp.]|uniref:Crp/Fnr family transcriptional regulator n=1 Tax=uncultured Tenacibaculum sp. TaxID=174713 RepID=UPI002630D2D2|nr:Crp/Fnr family transcriptional regulator [uncultured Tenacibaculum sp.]